MLEIKFVFAYDESTLQKYLKTQFSLLSPGVTKHYNVNNEIQVIVLQNITMLTMKYYIDDSVVKQLIIILKHNSLYYLPLNR
jgi:hypothetical protein